MKPRVPECPPCFLSTVRLCETEDFKRSRFFKSLLLQTCACGFLYKPGYSKCDQKHKELRPKDKPRQAGVDCRYRCMHCSRLKKLKLNHCAVANFKDAIFFLEKVAKSAIEGATCVTPHPKHRKEGCILGW